MIMKSNPQRSRPAPATPSRASTRIQTAEPGHSHALAAWLPNAEEPPSAANAHWPSGFMIIEDLGAYSTDNPR